MAILRCLVVALSLPAAAMAQTLPGTYSVTGTYSQTIRPYKGSLTITARGAVYDLKWTTGKGEVDSGSGFLVGNVLAASAGPAPCGVAAYRIGDGPLEGRWIETGGTGRGKETWRRRGSDPGLSGTFSVDGTNADGSAYSGTVTVEPKGELFRVEWQAGGEQSGYGLRRGDVLVVGYGGRCQFAAYTVTEGRLDGVWAQTATGRTGTEIATR